MHFFGTMRLLSLAAFFMTANCPAAANTAGGDEDNMKESFVPVQDCRYDAGIHDVQVTLGLDNTRM